jgi:alkylhydroperoxidase/carboxymuconolactone decarboxylase family protein YurZ
MDDSHDVHDVERYELGMETRRRIAGEGRFDPTTDSDFRRDLRDLSTRYVWGEVWSRPGLEARDRSLITIAMLIALRMEDELRSHVVTSLRLGITILELKELLLHSAVYVGMPAANHAFDIVESVLQEKGILGEQ